VWCWGDSKGNFETGVNRYVYEIYVKARCPLVTKDKPWIIPLTGDLARVNYRGKAITMAGPKQADPRLPWNNEIKQSVSKLVHPCRLWVRE
jgi:hypothetical protein